MAIASKTTHIAMPERICIMPKAIWNGVVLADSEKTHVVEGNHYFPPDSLNWQHFTPTDHRTICFWKGTASYYDVVVDGKTYANGAWTYPMPKQAAEEIRDYVAFYQQVKIAK